MSSWSSFDADKGITDAWRTFLKEEPEPAAAPEEPTERPPAPPSPRATAAKPIFGLTSKQPDSLISILGQLGFLTPQQLQGIVSKFAEIADDEDVVLEAVALKGAQSEQDRVFGPESTREITQLVGALSLDDVKRKEVLKAINYWARVNTVKFSSAPAPRREPEEAPRREPEGLPVSTGPTPGAPSPDDETPPEEEVTEPLEGGAPEEESVIPSAEEIEKKEVIELGDDEAVEAMMAKAKEEEQKEPGSMLNWMADSVLLKNPLLALPTSLTKAVKYIYDNKDTEKSKPKLLFKAFLKGATTGLDAMAWDTIDDDGLQMIVDGDYEKGLLRIIDESYGGFMTLVKICHYMSPIVCNPKIWIPAAAFLATIPIFGWISGAGGAVLVGAICALSYIEPLLPKELSLETLREFKDNPYFEAGRKADTDKGGIKKMIAAVEKGIEQGYGLNDKSLKNKKLVKPDVATPDDKANYKKYLVGLKAQQAQDMAMEKLMAQAAKLADSGPEPATDAAPEKEAAAQQQEHMIYERWQLIAGINKRVL